MPRLARWLLPFALMLAPVARVGAEAPSALFARENLIAWCIVPFDSKQRGPEERAAMLKRLGFRHFAYDWRAKDIPTFDAEVEALRKEGVGLDAFWVAPGVLNRESRIILDVLGRHGVKATLWVLLDQGPGRAEGAEQLRRVAASRDALNPLAEEAAKVGCSLALYNHGGWFGEPENQVAIIKALKARGVGNVGMVYNLHHGHEHSARLAGVLQLAMPYLKAVNLNGMDPGPDPGARKILPLGQGAMDLDLLRTIAESGYKGPIGILGHTNDDAEERLLDNLDGLDWLVPQLEGKAPGPRPKPRTPVPALPTVKAEVAPGDPATVNALLAEARASGNARRGAEVFASARFACLGCHKVGGVGGEVGPDLSDAGACLKAEEVVESILWPAHRQLQRRPGLRRLGSVRPPEPALDPPLLRRGVGLRPAARPGRRPRAAFHRLPGLCPGPEDDRRPPDPGRHGNPDDQADSQPLGVADRRGPVDPGRGGEEPELRPALADGEAR